MFVDEVTIRLKAGDGGNGCMSFRRVAHNPKGGPDGGNGGRGGDIILVCDPNTTDFTDYKFKPHATAANGVPGKGSDMDGANGPSLKLKMPPGTVVIDEETGETVLELIEYNKEYILLKGGKGGLGNTTFKSSVNQAPRQYTPGVPGEEGTFKLVLKSIADVGLVGFPNAGKSTLISLLTGASPKTASYPFTTLQPTVAVVEYPETYERLTMADIPGLIEGAHENRGLGHRFLRHIERCHLLLLLIDMAGTDGRDPVDDYKQLMEELRLYDETMLDKPRLIVANKMDEPAAAENLARFKKKIRRKVHELSCLSDDGLPELKALLRKHVLQGKK
jgi:GTP-binding protein